jgi:hypothetical protein
MHQAMRTILIIVLLILSVVVGSVVITDGSVIIADLGKHIMKLFK